MRDMVAGWRRRGHSIGLVPTMGALHDGHLSLVRAALAENDRVVVSIFVNPLQFAPTEDFASYPRGIDRDLNALQEQPPAVVFAPTVEAMYPPAASTRVRVGGLDEVLEGVHRAGHFEGVATVVSKLFWAVRPDRAYFGQKDAQQVAVVSRMAADLDTGVDIRVCPIVREPDGLAMSSRNVNLNPQERKSAVVLSRALRAANDAHTAGQRDPAQLEGVLRRILDEEPAAHTDYARVVDPVDFRSPGALAVLAVRIGQTRLIDNHLLGQSFQIALPR
ncbi:MAG: pantoate--beta-alanine ligase [Candidatus Dormibacteraeota bacterium]|nr:pantoate--beta-alanine ligase [Candidatus Dormibacteraeota bacterium]